MIDFYPISRSQLLVADFPLNHDCVIKVYYIPGSPLRFQYFSCRSQDTGILADILRKVALVSRVSVSTVDNLPASW